MTTNPLPKPFRYQPQASKQTAPHVEGVITYFSPNESLTEADCTTLNHAMFCITDPNCHAPEDIQLAAALLAKKYRSDQTVCQLLTETLLLWPTIFAKDAPCH